MNLIKAEFLKLTYQRRTWILVFYTIFMATIATTISPWAATKALQGDLGNYALSSVDAIDSVYAKALGGYLLIVVLGVLIMSSEFQHHTAIATFLAAPKRKTVYIAKLITAALAGGILNLVATGIGMAGATIVLKTWYPEAAEPHDYIWVDYLSSAFLIGVVLSVIGLAVGTLIRSQSGAITVSMLWFALVDRLLAYLFVDIGKYLPTGLITSLMNLHINVKEKQTGIGINTADYLDPWPAAGLLALYGIVFGAVAMFTTLRQDID